MAYPWKAFRDPRLPKNYFRVQANTSYYKNRCFGVELYQDESLIYSVFSKIFLFFTAIVYTSIELYEIYARWGDLNAMIGIVNYFFTHLTGTVKTGILYYNRKKIGQMMKSMHEPPFKPDETRGGKIESLLIRNIIKKTEIQYIVYFSAIGGTIILGFLKSVHIRITKPEEEWVFPFAPTMSLGEWIKHSPYFVCGIIYQFWGVLSFAMIIGTTDVLLSTLMAHVSVQMKILGDTFRIMKTRAETMAGAMKDNDDVVGKHMDNLMREAIQHHLKSLDLRDEIEQLCSHMALTNLLANVILLCFLLYLASLNPPGSVEFFQNICYWFLIVVQVGMYCYWGNEVSVEGENVAKGAAELDWPGQSKKITHALVMIIRRAQRPLYITAGKFVPLSMEVYMKMIKGSFSYFMVLKQTQGRA